MDREKRSAERRVKNARFPLIKTLDTFDFTAQPSIEAKRVQELMVGEYVDRHENVLLVGNSGTGKTHLAGALGFAACMQGRKVRFFTVKALVNHLTEMTGRQSLRDIEACLRAMKPKLYHMGIRGRVSRSTLADANEKRPWQTYADFAQVLIGVARGLYARRALGLDLDQTVYALASTTIDVCLSLFPWARFRRSKGAINVHTQLELQSKIPTFLSVSREA